MLSGETPCPVHVLGGHRIVHPRTWIPLIQYARAKRAAWFQVACIFFNDASVMGPPVFRARGILPIISCRDMGYWYTRRCLLALRWTGRFVSHVVVNSEAVLEVTHQSRNIPTSRISVFYNGYEEPSARGKAAIPELQSIKNQSSGPLAVLVANCRSIKRIPGAIRAIIALREQGIMLSLVLIGGGGLAEFWQLAECGGVAGQGRFLGPRSDVRNCLSYMDIGLLCSESEGYSNVIVEYMNQGLPLVVSSVGSNMEAVDHNRANFLYRVGDTMRLAQHLGSLVEDPRMRRELGEAGKQLAKQRHALTAMVEAHVELYRGLTDNMISKPEKRMLS